MNPIMILESGRPFRSDLTGRDGRGRGKRGGAGLWDSLARVRGSGTGWQAYGILNKVAVWRRLQAKQNAEANARAMVVPVQSPACLVDDNEVTRGER